MGIHIHLAVFPLGKSEARHHHLALEHAVDHAAIGLGQQIAGIIHIARHIFAVDALRDCGVQAFRIVESQGGIAVEVGVNLIGSSLEHIGLNVEFLHAAGDHHSA